VIERAQRDRLAALLHAQKLLLFRGAHRKNEPSAFGKLRLQRRGNFGRRRGDENSLEGGPIRPSQSTIAHAHMYVAIAQPRQPLAARDDEIFVRLHGVNFARQQR
jgi:hypothetical protein